MRAAHNCHVAFPGSLASFGLTSSQTIQESEILGATTLYPSASFIPKRSTSRCLPDDRSRRPSTACTAAGAIPCVGGDAVGVVRDLRPRRELIFAEGERRQGRVYSGDDLRVSCRLGRADRGAPHGRSTRPAGRFARSVRQSTTCEHERDPQARHPDRPLRHMTHHYLPTDDGPWVTGMRGPVRQGRAPRGEDYGAETTARRKWLYTPFQTTALS